MTSADYDRPLATESGATPNASLRGLAFESLVTEFKKAPAENMLNAESHVHVTDEAQRTAVNERTTRVQKASIRAQSASDKNNLPHRQRRLVPAKTGQYKRRFPGFDSKIILVYVPKFIERKQETKANRFLPNPGIPARIWDEADATPVYSFNANGRLHSRRRMACILLVPQRSK